MPWDTCLRAKEIERRRQRKEKLNRPPPDNALDVAKYVAARTE